jgi:hypothetical protein
LKNDLVHEVEWNQRHLKRDFPKDLLVDSYGKTVHNSCINHCLPYAFGNCAELHSSSCEKCTRLFTLFSSLEEKLPENEKDVLKDCQERILCYLAHQIRKTYLNAQFNPTLMELDAEGALFIVDYKMRILPKSARETKQEFFGKRGWTLHTTLVYTRSDNDNENFNIHAYDHWSDDTKQDAWFTASSLHAVISNLNPCPKWITIISDNGPHYHNSELMAILAHWRDWYDIEVRRWLFLEAGEAKTTIDSHHAQVSNLYCVLYSLCYDINYFAS